MPDTGLHIEVAMLRERAGYYETHARYAPPDEAAEARATADRLRDLAKKLETEAFGGGR